MKVFVIFICLVFFGCEKHEKGINKKLYNTIMSYQNEITVPLKNRKDLKNSLASTSNYVYEVIFDVNNKDTVMSITLKPQGIGINSNNFGIYKDNKLYPTVINDKDKSGIQFIDEYRKDGLEKFSYKGGSIVDKAYPIYLYQVRGNNLLFIEKLK